MLLIYYEYAIISVSGVLRIANAEQEGAKMIFPGENINQGLGRVSGGSEKFENGADLSVRKESNSWESLGDEVAFAGDSEKKDSKREIVDATELSAGGEQEKNGAENKEKEEKFVQEKIDFAIKTYVERGMKAQGINLASPNKKMLSREEFEKIGLESLKSNFERLINETRGGNGDNFSGAMYAGGMQPIEVNSIKELFRVGYISDSGDFDEKDGDFDSWAETTGVYTQNRRNIEWSNPKNVNFLMKGISEAVKEAPASIERLYDKEYGEAVENEKLAKEIMETMNSW
ncbi:hypothetical protein IKF33_02560 [Candidatus Saccharibacteria bacterium]|nr:hypothetical protein [Candidatus Saccharibacteria bacterium]